MSEPMLKKMGIGDMGSAATVHRASFDDRLPWLAGLHTPEEDLTYFREHLFPSCEMWGAFDRDGLAAIIAFRPDWIDQLYVLPAKQGRGVGTALLNTAKAKAELLNLWTFQQNAGARRFYERHGFIAIETTDGSGNEEREPDVLYRWRASVR
jgi:GNAT superfamily N-acetyltransferase